MYLPPTPYPSPREFWMREDRPKYTPLLKSKWGTAPKSHLLRRAIYFYGQARNLNMAEKGPIWVWRALDRCTRGETHPKNGFPMVPGPPKATRGTKQPIFMVFKIMKCVVLGLFWPPAAPGPCGIASLDPFHPGCTCPELARPKSDHFSAILRFWTPP